MAIESTATSMRISQRQIPTRCQSWTTATVTLVAVLGLVGCSNGESDSDVGSQSKNSVCDSTNQSIAKQNEAQAKAREKQASNEFLTGKAKDYSVPPEGSGTLEQIPCSTDESNAEALFEKASGEIDAASTAPAKTIKPAAESLQNKGLEAQQAAKAPDEPSQWVKDQMGSPIPAPTVTNPTTPTIQNSGTNCNGIQGVGLPQWDVACARTPGTNGGVSNGALGLTEQK